LSRWPESLGMNFPFWGVPGIGGEIVAGVVSLFFAVAACFAIGGGTFQILLEHKAQRTGDQPLLLFLQDWSRFLLLMILIVGLVAWMGVWFLFMLIAPHATMAFISICFWLWAGLWILFLALTVSALFYHSTWGVVSPEDHLSIGWIFVAVAWLSLFAVNGALSFMLVPEEWLKTGNTMAACFAGSFWPSLFMRGSAAIGIAGLICLVTASEASPPSLRQHLVLFASSFIMPGFALLPLAAIWHVAVLPPRMRGMLLSAGSPVTLFFVGALVLSVIIFAFVAAGPFKRPKSSTRAFALLLLVLGIGVVSTMEWVGGVMRSPYSISDYLYLNGVESRMVPEIRREGFLKHANYSAVKSVKGQEIKAGEEMFRFQCMICHTMHGHNSIKWAMRGWNSGVVDRQLENLETLRGNMPPFAGTATERRALAQWLVSIIERKGEGKK